MLGFLKQLLQKQRKITIKGNIMKFNDNQNYDVEAYFTKEFLSIEVYARFGMLHKDYNFPEYFLFLNINNKTIGETILLALSKSRTITSQQEYATLFDLGAYDKKYSEYENFLMQKYNYKNKKALFQNMKMCGINLKNNIITIKPTKHEKLKAWSGIGITKDDYVILSLDNSPEEIGAGLKLAFSRCI